MKHQTSDEIIKEAEAVLNDSPQYYVYHKDSFVLGYLKQKYDSLLESISRDTKDKVIAATEEATYEDMVEKHEAFKEPLEIDIQ